MRSIIKNDHGFTLIELMVVIIVLGILASIAIPRFLGVKEQARDVEAEALGRNIRTAMEAYYQNNSGYPIETIINNFNDLNSELDLFDFNNNESDIELLEYSLNNPEEYEMEIKNNKTGVIFSITSSSFEILDT